MNTYRLTSSTPTALRACGLNAIGSADEDWLLEQSNDEREHIRTWAIKLLCDQEALSKKTQKRFIEMGGQDKAGLVQLQLASARSNCRWKTAGLWPMRSCLRTPSPRIRCFLCLSGTASTRRSPKTATPP